VDQGDFDRRLRRAVTFVVSVCALVVALALMAVADGHGTPLRASTALGPFLGAGHDPTLVPVDVPATTPRAIRTRPPGPTSTIPAPVVDPTPPVAATPATLVGRIEPEPSSTNRAPTTAPPTVTPPSAPTPTTGPPSSHPPTTTPPDKPPTTTPPTTTPPTTVPPITAGHGDGDIHDDGNDHGHHHGNDDGHHGHGDRDDDHGDGDDDGGHDRPGGDCPGGRRS